jgi:RNA polymerase sigma-70 factor, ECF subfamily
MISADPEREDVLKAQKHPRHFGVLYTRYYLSIWNFIRKKISSDDICDDLTSQTFMKALEKIALFRWQGVSFKSWLYRIARNTVYDHFRSAAVRTSRGFSDSLEDSLTDDTSLERDVLHDERELKLFEAIASLGAKDQYLLYYRYFEGLSVEEISDEVGMSKANVATRLHRVRKLVEQQMEHTDVSRVNVR